MSGSGGHRRCVVLRQSEPYPYGWVTQEAQALAEAGFWVKLSCSTGLGHQALDETVNA